MKTKEENPNGLHAKYYIQKYKGKEFSHFSTFFNEPVYEPIFEPVDKDSEYFVLRLDDKCKDKKHLEACRKAVLKYADEIEEHLPILAKDLRERYLIN